MVFWNLLASRGIREEIVARGPSHFRTVADDQFCLNEVVQTKYFDQLRILPCQFNYRSHILNVRQSAIATVGHLDGIMIYHNARCMDLAKQLRPVRPKAQLPELEPDGKPLTKREMFWRRVGQKLKPQSQDYRDES